jgi:hypothetical protein
MTQAAEADPRAALSTSRDPTDTDGRRPSVVGTVLAADDGLLTDEDLLTGRPTLAIPRSCHNA